MTLRRWLVAAGLVLALAVPASATPIEFGGGLLDGVLRTYRLHESPVNFLYDVVPLRNYVLGLDFYPGVPLSVQNGTLPYSRCVQHGINYAALNNPLPCLSFFFHWTTLPFGEGDLRDGCTAIGPESPPGRPLMVERGNCTFREKWAIAESQGWGGVLVVNDAPGPVGAVGLIPDPSSPEPAIAFMRLTQPVGDQIRADWEAGILALEMQVHWTPKVSAPEPATLMLLSVGLAAAVRRRRRSSN